MATDAQAWDVLFALADKLGIDPEDARKADGKPSDVFMQHIGRIEQERDALVDALEDITQAAQQEGLHTRGWGEQVRTAVLALGGSYEHLARRDACMKAKALMDMANAYEDHHEILDHLRDAAEAYRKQAEGEP